MSRILLTFSLLAFGCLVGSAQAQITYPMLNDVRPVAVQVGTTSEHDLSAKYDWNDSYQVLVSGTGVTGEIVPPAPGKDGKPAGAPKVRFTTTADAQPGVRDFRVITPRGPSTLGQLVVSREPVVRETGVNDPFAKAQEITVPAALCGAIEKVEDVDFYRFKVDAGSTWVFHVRCARLQDRIHDLQTHADPIITLKNAAGVDLAQVDNYFSADPLLAYTFKDAGEYTLEMRDVRYQGNAFWQYCVEITSAPLVTNTFPLQAVPGVAQEFELIGPNLPAGTLTKWQPAADLPLGLSEQALPYQQTKLTPVPLFISNVPPVREQGEPHATAEKAQVVTVPCAINGRLTQEADVDVYAFEAKKGDRFNLEVIARRAQSGMDPIMAILNAKGARVIENDDLKEGRVTSADSQLENWTAPADGKYFVELRDLQLRGGPQFVYVLQITRSEPQYTLYLDTDKTPIVAGCGAAIFVKTFRKNGFDAPIELQVEGLPPGVTAACSTIRANQTDGVLVLSAAADAPQVCGNITVRGTATVTGADGMPQTLVVQAQNWQEIYMPGGGRGHFASAMHTVSICQGLDLKTVQAGPPEIRLRPGESQTINVTIDRGGKGSQNITLDLIYRHGNSIFGDVLPKGVTIDVKKSNTKISGKQTEGQITITAAKDAPPCERQLIPVMAQVAINFVMKSSFVGPPVWVSVEAVEVAQPK